MASLTSCEGQLSGRVAAVLPGTLATEVLVSQGAGGSSAFRSKSDTARSVDLIGVPVIHVWHVRTCRVRVLGVLRVSAIGAGG